MDIKKEFNRLQALISGYALEHPEIDFVPISQRVEDISKEVERKMNQLDAELLGNEIETVFRELREQY